MNDSTRKELQLEILKTHNLLSALHKLIFSQAKLVAMQQNYETAIDNGKHHLNLWECDEINDLLLNAHSKVQGLEEELKVG
jgi:hypothetical protein